MIEFKTDGDIFLEDVQALVNPVNCDGFMGKGLADKFKKKFKDNFEAYQHACDKKKVVPKKMFVHRVGDLFGSVEFIINFPTKDHWRGRSKISYIEDGLEDLLKVIQSNKIKSIAMPALGCGLGGLSWQQVKSCIEKAMESLPDVRVVVFAPQGAMSHK